MILDHVDNASLYVGLGERMAVALKYLQTTDFATLAAGRYEIDGDTIFALVLDYETKETHTTFWEAHRKYIDVHYVQSGAELMGYVPLACMRMGPYNEEEDFLQADGDGEFFLLREGFFAVLGPQDAHMPGISRGTAARVRKVVIKVRTD